MLPEEFYLELSETPTRFEAVNQLTNVFFDDSNKQVFTVRSGGVLGVVVKGPSTTYNFQLSQPQQNPVLSIKFSPDCRILAVQRTNSSVEFFNFDGTALDMEYSQTSRKNANILGFVWSQHNEVAFMTDHGIELYLVLAEKKSLKFIKNTSVSMQWFVWCSLNKLALLATAHGSHLQPVLFKPGSVNKLPKVDTEPGRMALERDVTLSTLYGVPAVLILRHQSGPQNAEVHVHMLSGPGMTAVKSHVLKLGLSGRFAINIVDDLIIVHHQASRMSQVFDIALPGESDGSVRYHSNIAPAKSIKPAKITLPGLMEPETQYCELYSPNWVVFQPNIVIDAKLGCLWHVNLNLKELCAAIDDLSICTQVALKRNNGKAILLQLLLDDANKSAPSLDKLHDSFDHINTAYLDRLQVELQSRTATPPGAPIGRTTPTQPRPQIVIDQSDVYTEILQKLSGDHRLEWVLTAYMTSLHEHSIPAQHNLTELLIKTLAKKEKFTALQQLLQYGVIADSKMSACLLLALGNMHAAATQMALDMLARLGATEEIQEVLLSNGQVLAALKVGMEGVNPRKYLEAAKNSGQEDLFHTMVYFFQNSSQFAQCFKTDDRLTSFVQHYDSIFNQ